MSASGLTGSPEWLSVGRCLGEGGFGVVYEAYDRRRKTHVAVKTLRRFGGAALLRFKREFRSMVDLVHPNLVTLHDLVSDGEHWFFTMELVEGPNLIRHVRGPGARAEGELPPIDRLCDAFVQLTEGVCALHAAGILHRDLKPSNVLVHADGRVVVLDFGLARQLAASGDVSSEDVLGTPAYMPPEQMDGAASAEPSDWYGVGVMLYEALTGECPFHGGFVDLFAAKHRSAPPGPRDRIPAAPADLDALCRDLLHPDPTARPGGQDVLARLRAAKGATSLAIVTASAPRPHDFVDREGYLEALDAAFQATKGGRTLAVALRGRSGIGKTALARRFLADVHRREPNVVLLAGRCYEQESVPYKALDSLIDDLGRYLNRLPALEAARLMPRNVLELARLFPVLRELQALASAHERAHEIPNAQELRRRAATALRELLQRLADERPLVLYIDDLQWGDVDSGVLLNEIMRPPDPPPLLLIACYRSEDEAQSPLLGMLREARATWAPASELIDLEVGQLPLDRARELAVLLLAEHGRGADVQAEAIARESAGHPFFLNELARYVLAQGEREERETSLDDVIRARVSPLPEDARRLLDIVAVAGQPLPLRVVQAAAAFEADEPATVQILRLARLVRTRASEPHVEIETYHDRIREALVSHLRDETLREYHERLAWALEDLGGADPETLAVHFRAAGQPRKAATYAARGAQQAADALAFDRAARLYRLALELAQFESAEDQALRVKLADALANAGRGAAAGEAYLLAAEAAGPTESIEYRRRAAEQFLISGHLDEGLVALENVLRLLGMRFARTPGRAVVSFLLRRAWLGLRGLGFRERVAADLTPDELLRIDSGWAVGIGLGMADPVRGADFQVGHLLAALRAGEPYRIARALAVELGYSTLRGKRSRRRAERLGAITQQLAERVGHPHALGISLLNRAVAANLRGHFRRSHDLCERAEAVLRERCTGVTWELDTTLIFRVHSLAWTGAWRALAERVPALLKEAQDRGDLYLATYLRARIRYLLRLAADDATTAREEQVVSLEGWSRQGFLVQHYWDWFARGEIDLYMGDARRAWDGVCRHWSDYRRSHLDRFEALHIEGTYLRARAALALAATRGGAGDVTLRHLVREVTRGARRIERERAHWGDPLAQLLRAGLAATRGDFASALRLASSAEDEFRAADIGHYAAAARRRRGELLPGPEGESLLASADAWMREQGIANPKRMTAMLAPGAWQRALS